MKENKLEGISIQHNLTEDNLHFCIDNFDEKMISPCLAVVKNENLLDGFGEIKLLSYKNDDIMKKSQIYSSDIYSPRMDFLYYKIDSMRLSKYFKEKWGESIYCERKYYNEYFFDKEIGYNAKEIIRKQHPKYQEMKRISDRRMKIQSKLDEPKPKGTLSRDKELEFDNLKEELSNLREEVNNLNRFIDDYDKVKGEYFTKIKSIKEKITNIHNERTLEPNVLEEWEERQTKYNKTLTNYNIKYKKLYKEIKSFSDKEINFILTEFKEEGVYIINGENRISGRKLYKKADNKLILRKLKKDLVNGESFSANGFIYLRNCLADKFTYAQYTKYSDNLASNEEESKESEKEFEKYILENYTEMFENLEYDSDKLHKFYSMFEKGEIKQSSTLKRMFNSIFKSHYFEAKPQREVEFDEFEIALVPNTREEKTIKFLERNNLKVFKYKPKEDVNLFYSKIRKKLDKQLKNNNKNNLEIN